MVNLKEEKLIDTHALIWYFEDSPDIPEKVKMIIYHTPAKRKRGYNDKYNKKHNEKYKKKPKSCNDRGRQYLYA